jgi:8-oxo-dGTP pyrophosphatase MutT (NUDIX family)
MLSWEAMSLLVETVRERLRERVPAKAPAGLRPAAVLIPIVVEPDGESLLLTRRAETLRRQPGDISFPGGALDPSDETPLAAALRESREEVGLAAEAVTLLGQLDERGTITGFRITPFVGAILRPYVFEPNHEVGALLKVPLAALADPGALTIEKRRVNGAVRDVYHYRYREHDIWGITGRLVKDFLELIR